LTSQAAVSYSYHLIFSSEPE